MNELVHTGIAVRDIDEAMVTVGAALQVSWATPQVRQLSAFWRGRSLSTDVRVTWSLEGPPHIELVCGGPSTPWDTDRESVLHHVAFWTDDLTGDVEHLRGVGCELELTGAAASGAPSSFAYMCRPEGLRIELMDRAVMKPAFDAWLAGGDLPQTVS